VRAQQAHTTAGQKPQAKRVSFAVAVDSAIGQKGFEVGSEQVCQRAIDSAASSLGNMPMTITVFRYRQRV